MRGGSLEDPDPLDRRPITRLLGSVYRRVCKHASVTSSVRGSGRESRGGMKSEARHACTTCVYKRARTMLGVGRSDVCTSGLGRDHTSGPKRADP